MNRPDIRDEPDDLARQLRNIEESLLVANDKLEIALNNIDRTLKQTNNVLASIATEIRQKRS